MNSPDIVQPAPRIRADLALLALALMWGTTFVITKEVVSTHSPFFYTSVRFGVASLAFILIFRKHLLHVPWNEVREGIILGVCVFMSITLQVFGIVFTTASKAGFITGLYLVFTPIISYALFRVQPTRDNLAGLVLAVVGFTVLTLPSSGESLNRGDFLVLCAASMWAAHIVATSVFGSRSDVRTLAAVQVFTVAILALIAYAILHTAALSSSDFSSLPRLIALEGRDNALTWRFAAQVGYMAVFATVVAALVQTWAQGKMTPSHAAIVYALEPVSGAFFAYLAFNERLQWRGWMGAIAILAGIMVSRLGLFSRVFLKTAAVETA